MAKVPAGWRYAAAQAEALSARQCAVLDLIVRGRTNQEIADLLEISLAGAKERVSELLGVLGFFSREEMAEFWAWHRARKRGLGPPAIGGLRRSRWIGPAAALGVGLAVAVPWLNLRAWRADETAVRTSETSPAAVPSREPSVALRAEELALPPPGPEGRLAYLNEAGDLMVKPMPSGTAEVVRRANGLRAPRWSPSGNYLAVVERGTLTVLDERGKLTAIAAVDGDTWAWSPTSDSLAVFTGAGMWLYDPVSGATKFLRGQGAPLPEAPGPIIWSPDGTRLLYRLSWSVTAPGRDTTSEMRVFDLRTGEDRLLGSEKIPPQGGTSPMGWSGDEDWEY